MDKRPKPASNGADGQGPDATRRGRPLREDRLKAALKANIARRKAQVKARAGDATGAGDKAPDNESE